MAPGGSLCAKIRFRSNAQERQCMWLAVNRLDIILIDRPLRKPRSVIKTYSIFSCKWNLYGRQILYWFFVLSLHAHLLPYCWRPLMVYVRKIFVLLRNIFRVHEWKHILFPFFIHISSKKNICISFINYFRHDFWVKDKLFFYDDLISTASCRLRRRCVKKIALLLDQISSFGSSSYLVSLDNKQKLQKLTNLIRRKSVKIKKSLLQKGRKRNRFLIHHLSQKWTCWLFIYKQTNVW